MTDRAGRNRLRKAKAAKTREKIADAAASSRRLIQFDFTKRVAIYARWSNLIQMDRHQQSLKDQTEGQRQRAIELDWREDQIDVIMADADYSGTVDIDDRDPEGLPLLLKKIKAGTYGAVFSWMEDRLFRDEYLDNATRFARVCGEAKCYLVTERYVYDLSDVMERERFLMEVKFGWFYYKNQILGNLLERKMTAARNGKFDGRNMPVGYTVRYEKDGSKLTRTWEKQEAHAKKLNEWADLLLELGSFPRFCRAAREHVGPHFPSINDPHFKTAMTEYPGGGWRIVSVRSWSRIFRNRAYLGEWEIEGKFIEGHHDAVWTRERWEAIQRVLNLTSNISRPKKKPVEAPYLLHNCEHFHGPEGTYLTYHSRNTSYRVMKLLDMKELVLLHFRADVLEKAFMATLLDHIRQSRNYTDFAKRAKEVQDRQREYIAGVGESITEIAAAISEQEDTLEAAALLEVKAKKEKDAAKQAILSKRASDMERKATARIKELEVRRTVLQEKIKHAPQDGDRMFRLVEVLTMLDTHLSEFNQELLQDLVDLAVEDAELAPLSSHFVLLRIQWRYLWEPQDLVFYRRNPAPKRMTEEEKAFLKENFTTMTPDQLVEAFPSRPWTGLRVTATHLGHAWIPSTGMKHPETLSVEDCAVMEQYQIALEEVGGGREQKVAQEPYRSFVRAAISTQNSLLSG